MVRLSDRLAALKLAAINRQAVAVAEKNRNTEFQAKDGLGGDSIEAPLLLVQFETMDTKEGFRSWLDKDFREWFCRKYPWAVAKCSRGTRGQEYAGTRYLTKEPLPRGTLFVPPHIAAQRKAAA